MRCRITDMHNKEVINICDGTRLGYVDDVEVDTVTAELVAIVLNGRSKFFGLMGHDDDCVICWKDIEVIGEETILVNQSAVPTPPHGRERRSRKRNVMSGIFG